MTVDVDAVNDRLNGLVTLLKAVGVDSSVGSKGGSSKGGIPDARQLDDEQIEAIIKKLQMAQTEAPQIIAALEAQSKMKKELQQSPYRSGSGHQRQSREVHEEEIVHAAHEDHDEDDDEDEDSFDEDANYPMVGHGCSDDVSIMSDLTTPTVVQGSSVPDEEHYRDTLPPMIVGGHHNAPPMLIAPTKRKNLVGSVRSNTLAAPRSSASGRVLKAPPSNSNGISGTAIGGAAAQRRKHYNATMEKLAHEPLNTASQSHQHVQSKPAAPPKLRKVKPPQASSLPQQPVAVTQSVMAPLAVKKTVKTARRASVATGDQRSDWGEPEIAWNAFENTTAARSHTKPKTSVATTLIDDDGFLMGDGSFDPFQSAATTSFKAKNEHSSNNSTGHDAGKQIRRTKKKPSGTASPAVAPLNSTTPASFDGGFKTPAGFSEHQSAPQSRSRLSSSNTNPVSNAGSPPATSAVAKPRRSRRASLAM